MMVKDTIASRVGRIISGSAKKIVEILESAAPEMVMEGAINEIDNAVFEVREELGSAEADKHLANRQLIDANNRLEELGAQINVALDESREDLAEAAVQKQLDIESQIPIMQNTIDEADFSINELNSYIAALQAKKREMLDELRNWRSSKAITERITLSGPEKTDAEIEAKVARAESAFERIMNKTPSIEGFDADNAKKLAELEDLTRKNRIKERLSQIKANRVEG